MTYGLMTAGTLLAIGVLAWGRGLPTPAVGGAVGVAAGMVATGGLLLVGDATSADWVVALVVVIPASILHARLVLGPFGKPA